jgi:hypothetical protein
MPAASQAFGSKSTPMTMLPATKSPYVGPPLNVIPIPAGGEDAAWDSVRAATEKRLTSWGIRLLRSGLDKHVKTVVVEPRYVCKDYRNLFSHFYSKKFVERSSLASRLHFFASDSLDEDKVIFGSDDPNLKKAYLGFSVIEPIKDRCIGRTVIDPTKIGHSPSEVYCLRTPFRVRLNGAQYVVDGFPYRSQSAEATVCAHSALWGACRYLSERYPSYGEVYPYDLIEMTGDTAGRRVPYRAMTYADYSVILSDFGCHPAILRPRGTETKGSSGKVRDWTKDRPTFYDLYAYMESGFPVLASFGGHVVTIMGHTMRKGLPAGEPPDSGRFYNSCSLLREYIIIDDNFFPYQRLAYRGETPYYPNDCYTGLEFAPATDNISAAVVPLPEKAFLPPRSARAFSYGYLAHPDAAARIDSALGQAGLDPKAEKLVCRLFLTSSNSFKERKRLLFEKGGRSDDLLTYPLGLNLPHFVWVMEVAPLASHLNGQCIGEVLIDASVGKHECQPIYIRIGRSLISGKNSQEYPPSPVLFEQYTHNLGGRN